MLKGKKALYFLLPTVAIIWGGIIYQIVDAFSEPKDEIAMQLYATKPTTLQMSARDTFSLSTIERDPFLGTIYKPKEEKKFPVKVIKRTPTVQWPVIHYNGTVMDKQNGKTIYILEIDGTSYLLKEKQEVNGIRLQKGASKSVVVRHKGATKTVNMLH